MANAKLQPAVFPLASVSRLPLLVRALSSAGGLKKGEDYSLTGVASSGLVSLDGTPGLHRMDRLVELLDAKNA